MSLNKLSAETIAALSEAMAVEFSESEKHKISEIIQKALVKSIEEATKTHQKAAVICCGPEADLAHKFAEEMDRANKALVANLMALR